MHILNNTWPEFRGRRLCPSFIAAEFDDFLHVFLPADVTDKDIEEICRSLDGYPGLCPGPRPRSGRVPPAAPKPRDRRPA